MAEFQEEVYIIEKQEISDDEEDQEYERLMKQDHDIEDGDLNADLDLEDDDDDDLHDFNKLKAKQETKAAKQITKTGVSMEKGSSMLMGYKKTA